MDRYDAQSLEGFAATLLQRAGMHEDQARCTAHFLLEADLMGHTTHGLQLAGPYIKCIQAGDIRPDASIQVVRDTGVTATWDAGYLPGLWVTHQAIEGLRDRAKGHGMASLSIRRCGHIACLQAFLPEATRHGYLIILCCSDPSVRGVAPYGGREALITPDPIAIGIPTDADPVLVDISSTITTIGNAMRTHEAGETMPGEWFLTAEGIPTNDPAALTTDPRGTILPIGGTEYGHKGFGLALMVETLTQALAGHGRADDVETWGAGVYIQLIDPEAFGGSEAFLRQSTWLAAACVRSAPRPGVEAVRMPGQAALAKKKDMLRDGVTLHEAVLQTLTKWGAHFDVPMPAPME